MTGYELQISGVGSYCSTNHCPAGKSVASNTKDRIQSLSILFTINCIEKTRNKFDRRGQSYKRPSIVNYDYCRID